MAEHHRPPEDSRQVLVRARSRLGQRWEADPTGRREFAEWARGQDTPEVLGVATSTATVTVIAGAPLLLVEG
jgi:hypothetical protein